jgi:hypothetical protein
MTVRVEDKIEREAKEQKKKKVRDVKEDKESNILGAVI